MKHEIWKPVKGYEGLYEVSSFGRVRNTKGILKAQRDKKAKYTTYKQITLSKNDIPRTYGVHRLVAEAFIPNDKNLPYVNHIDENGINNNVENLEWCSLKYNTNYGTSAEKRRIAATGVIGHNRKPVMQIDVNGVVVKRYLSESGAANAIGGNQQAISRACMNGKIVYGFRWRHDNDD